MIGDPDPYDATMNALDQFTGRQGRHLDAARREVGLAAVRPDRARAAGTPTRQGRRTSRSTSRRRRTSDGSRRRSPTPARRTTTTTGRRRRTAPPAWSPSSSGCCFSSSRRSWSSGPSSRPTSSSGSWRGRSGSRSTEFELPKGVAGVNTLILVSSSLTMHWALEGAKHGNRAHLKAGLLLTLLLGSTFLFVQINEYVNLTQEGLTPSVLAAGLGLLRPDRPARRARLHRPDAAAVRDDPRVPRATSRPRSTVASRCRGSTGTSSTSCGSSCTRRSTSSSLKLPLGNPLRTEAAAFGWLLIVRRRDPGDHPPRPADPRDRLGRLASGACRFRPARGFPPPLQLVGFFSRPTAFLERCHERYGDVFTLRMPGSEPMVFLADPDLVKAVWTRDKVNGLPAGRRHHARSPCSARGRCCSRRAPSTCAAASSCCRRSTASGCAATASSWTRSRCATSSAGRSASRSRSCRACRRSRST